MCGSSGSWYALAPGEGPPAPLPCQPDARGDADWATAAACRGGSEEGAPQAAFLSVSRMAAFRVIWACGSSVTLRRFD